MTHAFSDRPRFAALSSLAAAGATLASSLLTPAPARAQIAPPPRAPQWNARYRAFKNDASVWADVAVDKRTGCAVVVGGGRNAAVAGTPFGIHVAKYSPAGRLLWRAFEPMSGAPSDVQGAQFVAVDDAGGIYVAGNQKAASGGGGYVTAKWTPAGRRVWISYQNSATGGTVDAVTGLAIDPAATGNRGVFVTGVLQETPSTFMFVTVRYNAQTGALEWTHRYDGPGGRSGRLASVAVDAARGYVYVAGETFTADSTPLYDFATLKLNAVTGAVVWERHWNRTPGVTSEALKGAKVDPITGGVYVAGTDYNAPGGGPDFALVKYDAAGAVLWSNFYNGFTDGFDLLNGFAVEAATGAVALTGATDAEPIGGFIYTDMATVKFTPSGVRAWATQYNGPADGDEAGLQTVFDPKTGDVLAAGTSLRAYDTGTGAETYGLAVARYAASNGAARWVGGYQGTDRTGSNPRDTPLGIAADAGGNLLLCGYGPSRFAPSPYGERWVLRYNNGAYAPLALSVGGDNKTRLLWERSSDAAPTVWRVNAAGAVEAGRTFAASGYAPVAVNADPSPTGDVTRLLLARSATGSAVVWNLAPNFAEVTKGATFGPLTDATGAWDAAALAQGGDGIARLLWHHRTPANSHPDQAAVWNLNGTTLALGASRAFGPVAGYEAAPAFSVGPLDNKPRLIWSTGQTENKIAVWTTQTALAGGIAGATFGPVGGGAWSCVAQATGGDGKTRLLWLDSDRSQFAVWTLNPAGTAIESSGLFGPVAGYAVMGIACGTTATDSRPRLLLLGLLEGGRAAVWTLNAQGTAIERGDTFTAK